jgi:hypothetical protein
VVPAPLALGQTREGALDEGHAFLENGALIDDYALDLEAGQRAVIDLRGGECTSAMPPAFFAAARLASPNATSPRMPVAQASPRAVPPLPAPDPSRRIAPCGTFVPV